MIPRNATNSFQALLFHKRENSLDAGIQDRRTSISIELKVEKRLLKEMVMKVTNVYKHEIVDTRA